MNSAAKSLILKGQDNLETARRLYEDDKQHDIVGYNLAQSCEYFLKALCTLRNLEYPHDGEQHDLDVLMSILEENRFAAISSHADIVELTPYNSVGATIHASDRLNLREYLGHVEDLKTLVGKEAAIA